MTRRAATRIFGFACTIVALGLPAAGQEGECPTLPDGWQRAGAELRLGDSAFELVVESADVQAADGGREELVLEIDLAVRLHDPATGVVRTTTQPTGLTGTYEWRGDDGTSVAGGLAQRISSRGSALGFVVRLPLPLLAEVYRLTLVLDRPSSASRCPSFPLTLRYELDARALEEREVARPSAPAQRAPAGDVRVNLLSQIDHRPAEDASDVWGYSNGVTHLAILGSQAGTLFIDVTNPSLPTQVGFIPGPNSIWRDIKTYQHWAYIVTEGSGAGQGLQIVDLADPLNPTLVNTYATNFATTHNLWIDTQRGHAWLVGTNAGARIVDLADPVNPVEIGSFTPRYVHDVFVSDGLAYFSEIFSGIHEIVDATDPGNLQILSTWSTPFNFTHNSWPNADFTLLVTSDEQTGGHLTAWDISDKDGPIPRLGEYEPNPAAIVHNVVFDDVPGANRVAISHYALGFKYVDLQRPTVPVELGSFDTRPQTETGFNGAWGVYPFDPRGYFYVGDIQSGLFVLEYAPTGGTFTGAVLDAETGVGIPGAEVQLLGQAVAIATNASGEFGRYVDAGPLQLRVEAPGYQTALLAPGTLLLDGGRDVVIQLQALARGAVGGTVRRAGDLQPIPSARISIVDTPFETVAGGAGEFTLPDVPVGQRIVAVEAVGYAGADATVLVDAGAALVVDFVLEPAALLDSLEVSSGWVREGGTATSGQWVRGDPIGTGGGLVQPEHDHTPSPGVACFFTGQGLSQGSTEFGDVDGGTTSVHSPIVDLTGAGNPSFRYHRWFSAQSGELDGGTYRVELSDDGGSTWTTVELLTEDANVWTASGAVIQEHVSLTDQFMARFSCEAIPEFDGMRVLECAFDDVEIVEECRARVSNGSDRDRDGALDACDACPDDSADDGDGDGVCGELDNAPFHANAGQEDGDADGVGDAGDNCAADPNPSQLDLDRDGLGNACDDDLDGDGVPDLADGDRDDDGVADASDLCVEVPDAAQLDRDSDGQGDACDEDDDVVHGVRLDGDLVRWQPEAGADAYDLYRGDVGLEALLALAGCRAPGVQGTAYLDRQLPQPGDGFLYLVAPVHGGTHGSLGAKSDGSPRQVSATCP
jgi:choice-of-anchor B domain-containing protein